jgi:hypothetical protein
MRAPGIYGPAFQYDRRSVSEVLQAGRTPVQRSTVENRTRLNFVMGAVSRLPFDNRIAPWSDDRMKSPTSLHLKSFGSSPTFTAAFKQAASEILKQVEDLDQAAPDRLIVSGYLRRVGAVQAPVLHAPLFEERPVGVDVGFKPPQRLQLLVVERFGEHFSGETELEI